MSRTENTTNETKAFGSKLGGLLLLFVVGCVAYIVFSPIIVTVGVVTNMMPYSHPAVIALMILMEVAIIVLTVMIVRRDRRFIYAYLAGGVVGVSMAVAQGVIGFTTLGMTIATVSICIIGAVLVVVYFLRSKRVKFYLETQ